MAVMVAADVDAPAAVKERLEAVRGRGAGRGDEPAGAADQRRLVCAGAFGAGARKSLEPIVERWADADYQSMQQFVADSPWDPALVVKAVAERVASRVDVEAWVLDDTGFPKDGKDSPA